MSEKKRSSTKTEWLILFSLAAFYTLFRPIDDLDLFTQIELGKLILRDLSLVTIEPFTYLNAGRPVQNPGWLAQVIFAALFEIGGWQMLRVFGAAMVAAALTLALKSSTAGEQRVSCFGLLTSMIFALLVCGGNNGVRPQIFSLVGFALLMVLRRSTRPLQHRLLLLAPILLVWQNTHSSLPIGIAWLALFGVREFFTVAPSGRARSAALTLVFIIFCSPFIFFTPLGFDILEFSRQNLYISRDLLGVSEWRPAWTGTLNDSMLGFWLAITCSLPLIVMKRRRAIIGELSEFLPFLLLTLYSARFCLYFALVAASIWPLWIENLTLPGLMSNLRRRLRLRRSAFVMTILCLSAPILPLTVFSPISPSIPLDAACRFAASTESGRIYNYREWGGILVHCGVAKNRLLIDGRLYLYSPEIWRRYNREAAAAYTLDQIIEFHNPQSFLLHEDFHAALISRLRADSRFREVMNENKVAGFHKGTYLSNASSKKNAAS